LPMWRVDGPKTARNSGWLMHVLNHRTRAGKGATNAASMTSLNGLSRHMATITSAAVTPLPTRKVEVSRCASSTANARRMSCLAFSVFVAFDSIKPSTG